MSALSLLFLVATAQAGTPDPGFEAEILASLNAARTSLAAGDVADDGTDGTWPAASNMQELRWDPALAALAAEYAGTCTSGVNANRNTEFYAHTAQASFVYPASNIYLGTNTYSLYTTSSDTVRPGLADTSVSNWTDQLADAYYTAYASSGALGQAKSGSQVIWANTRYVGCAVQYCEQFNPPYNAHLVNCNFFPAANYAGQYPYTTGTPADACPTDLPYAVDGVCAGCPDPSYTFDGSDTAQASCVNSPLSCTVDDDCDALDTCTDDDAQFSHTCVSSQCVRTPTECTFGSCALDTCSTTCPDGDDDGVCDADDLCEGDDSYGDANADGLCDPAFNLGVVSPGQSLTLTSSGNRPGSQAYFLASYRGPGTTCSPGDVVCVDLAQAFLLGGASVDNTGVAELTLTVPSNAPIGLWMGFQAVWIDGSVGATTNLELRRVRR